MKYITKILFWFILFWFLFSFSFAQDYLFFYGNGCSHCAKVEEFFKANSVQKFFSVQEKEVYFNRDNLKEFNNYAEKLNLSSDEMWVPFLVINWSGGECTYLAWDSSIIKYFQDKLDVLENTESCNHSWCGLVSCNHVECTANNCQKQWAIIEKWDLPEDKSLIKQRLWFFGIMLPAALSDSINPCAFAVMFLLLTAILSKHKSRRKTLLSWFMFALAIFVSYLAMGIGLFSALASSTNTFVLKLIVWILWILVWLANLKDYFRYWKWFVMEVPLSWRPKMQDLIYSVSSPWWAFVIWLLVSLFLLPCSSWPYFTILGYLSSQSKELTNWWYFYLIIYNLIFVLPMAIIAILVGFGYSTVDKLAKIKHNNTKLIHLIVGILMLGLWIYVLATM